MMYNCFTCPYGKESYKTSIAVYNALGEQPNHDDILHNLWCDKVGGKVGWCGYCDDAFSKEYLDDVKNIKKPFVRLTKKQKKRINQKKYKKHLKSLAKTLNYPQPAVLITEKWDKEKEKYVKLDTPYYKRLYKHAKRCKFFKRYSNKQIRLYKEKMQNGSGYKKIFNYAWEVE